MNKDHSLCSLHLSGWVFTPKILPTVVLLLVLPVLIALGYWQLQRAHYKQYLQQHYISQMAAKPKSLHAVYAMLQDRQNAKVYFTGHYDNTRQFFLDNQISQHQVGYQVLTPFIATGDTRWVLIDRGWVSQLATRTQLPHIPAVLGEQTVSGLVRVPAKPFLLAEQSLTPNWPMLIQAVQLDKMSQVLGRPLYPFVVLLAPKAAHGFVRNWQLVPTVSAHKHRAYALQWFALAVALVIVYVILSTSRAL